MAVKGKEKPQEAYELIKPTQVETRIGASVAKGLSRFVGRRREMETLREALDKAREGSGQVVGIVGEAGVGKSRLILELKNTLPTGQYTFLADRCLHYGGQMPYLPILDVLKGYFDIEEGDGEPAIKKKIRYRLRELNEQALPPDAASSMSTVSSRGPDVGAPLAAPDHPSWSGRASPCPYNCQDGVSRHLLKTGKGGFRRPVYPDPIRVGATQKVTTIYS